MGAETISDVSEDPGPVLQLDPVHAIGKRFKNPTVDEYGRPGHEARLYRTEAFIPKFAQAHSRTLRQRVAARPARPHTATLFGIAPFALVSTRGPFFVIATVCSKYADSEPSVVQTVQPSGLM